MSYAHCLHSIWVAWLLLVPALWIGFLLTVAVTFPVMDRSFSFVVLPFILVAAAINLLWAPFYFSFFGGLSLNGGLCNADVAKSRIEKYRFIDHLKHQIQAFRFDRENWLLGLSLFFKTLFIFFVWCIALQLPMLVGVGSDNLILVSVVQIVWIPIFMAIGGMLNSSGGKVQQSSNEPGMRLDDGLDRN